MIKTTTVQSRIDPELKQNAEAILKQLGLTSSQAINAFYAQIVLVKGLPFDVKLPSHETMAALNELNQGKGQRYNSFDNLIDDIGD